MPVVDLLHRHAPAWARATRHPFLDGVRDGSLPEPAFEAWLVQDHRFVADLLRFQARLLARAPRVAQPVLAAGAVALVDELAWFERHAAGRGLELAAAPLPATLAYAALLEQLDRTDPAVALVMLWAIERAYLDAWTYAAPGAPVYARFVAHWTVPEFARYVEDLAVAADAVAADTVAADAVAPAVDVDALFAEVVDAEGAFWDMAWQPA